MSEPADSVDIPIKIYVVCKTKDCRNKAAEIEVDTFVGCDVYCGPCGKILVSNAQAPA